MERYTLKDLFADGWADELKSALDLAVPSMKLMLYNQYAGSVYSTFIAYAIYNAFFDDYVNYEGNNQFEVKQIFVPRLAYDIAVKFPYWKTKYDYILKLFTPTELNLLQSSRMTSSSSEVVDNAGGTLQKTASTPTGVSTSSTGSDEIDITLDSDDDSTDVEVATDGFVEKYTNYEGKTSTASKSIGSREGDIMREGSIDELLKVLEKLPSSFADEITREVSHHFVFVYSY